MTAQTRLERDLTDWLSETAMPQTPDYADDILAETARIRQRPRWTFLRQWLPIPEVPWRVSFGGMSPVAAVLLLVVALLLAALATFVASRRPTVPSPFGPAGAGLLVASQGGDIVVSDPRTGVVWTIVPGDDIDEHPRWSLDGTRLAFLRQTQTGQAVVVIADSSGRILAISDLVYGLDTDSIRWSPDGTQIAFAGSSARATGIHVVEVATGAIRPVVMAYNDGEFFWRPPDGRQLLFASRRSGSGLALGSLADGTVTTLPTGDLEAQRIRVLGWTPDGRRALYQVDSVQPFRTVVVDIETGAEIHLNVGFGHVSNDGTRVAGIVQPSDGGGRLCVVPITGGDCDVVDGSILVDGTHGAAISWSPDDRWVAVLGDRVWLVDPNGIREPRALPADGPGSWQRIAP